MIRLIVKKGVYSYERVIFPTSSIESKADVIRYMRFYECPEWKNSVEWDTYRTPVTDLTNTEETIRRNYSKDVRYEVRRASRESICYVMRDTLNGEKDRELIEDVISKYYSFCDQIGMPNLKYNLDITEFYKMTSLNAIAISRAEFENGWIYHVYQIDGESALLWFSFSDYRKENANKSLSGWANRGLHDYDMMYFKSHGYSRYDWGNIASEDNPNQIDKFKMEFGGELTTAYCCFVGNTPKGKILIWLRKMKGKLQKS